MTFDLPTVLLFMAALYFFIESMAILSWAMWSFKGIRCRKKTLEVTMSAEDYSEFDRLLIKDEDIKKSGFPLMALEQGHYLVQIPPRAPKMQEGMPFPSFLTGELFFDRNSNRVTFMIRCTPSGMTFIIVGLASFLIRQYMAANYALMVLTIALWSIMFVFFYIFAYDRYIDDFWSVIKEKTESLTNTA